MSKATVMMACAVFACVALCAGPAGAQTTADIAKMIQDLTKQVQDNAEQIGELKQQLGEKDEQLKQKEAQIEALTKQIQPVAKIEAIEKKVAKLEAAPDASASVRKHAFTLFGGKHTGVLKQGNAEMFGGMLEFGILENSRGDRLSGQLFVSYSESERHIQCTTLEVVPTDGLFALDAGLNAVSLDGLAAVQPVNQYLDVELNIITVLFDAKYTIGGMGRFKPYVVAGAGAYVYGMEVEHNYTVGLVQPTERLEKEHYPSGNADLECGINVGGGFHYMITDWMSVGVDARAHVVSGTDKNFESVVGFVGLHF